MNAIALTARARFAHRSALAFPQPPPLRQLDSGGFGRKGARPPEFPSPLWGGAGVGFLDCA